MRRCTGQDSWGILIVMPLLCRGELYPCETDLRLCEELETGEEVEVDMNKDVLTVLATGKQYQLKPIGEVRGTLCISAVIVFVGSLGLVAPSNTLLGCQSSRHE